MGNAIAVIDGKEVLVDGKGGVHNIGAEIRGNEVTQVLSEKGKIVNESTVKNGLNPPFLSLQIVI